MSGVDGYEWDVAVSFAGEDRPLAHDVVRRLQEAGVRVFYDHDHVSTLWGENLVDLLHAIYSRQARFALLFLSRHYLAKNWSNHERQSVQERALTQRSPYILPVRIDDTDIPGLPATLGYLDARQHGPDGIARAVLDKLTPPGAADGYVGGVPASPGDEAALLHDRPPGWQNLLLAGTIRQGFVELRAAYHDHTLEHSTCPPRHVEDIEAVRRIADSMMTLHAIRGRFDTVFSIAAQEYAFTAADPDLIRHYGRRIVGVYQDFLDWAAGVRALIVTDRNLRRYGEWTARYADAPLLALRRFAAEYVTEAESSAADGPARIPIRIRLTMDENARRQATTALRDYCDSIGLPLDAVAPPELESDNGEPPRDEDDQQA